MYRHCTTEKTALQQKTFQEALFQTLQNHLYQDITIIDLCQHTGLSRNIFYRLFDCKDDVLHSLIDQALYSCNQAMHSGNSKENLLAFYAYWKNNRTLLEILDKNQLGPVLSTRCTLCCTHFDFDMQKFIHCDWSDYNIEILSFYVSGFVGLLFLWYHSDFSQSIEEMAHITLQILSQPPILIKK